MRLATSSYNPTSLMLCCAQPCQCVLSQPVANAHSSSSSVAPSRPTFAQRWQWGQLAPLRTWRSFFFELFPASASKGIQKWSERLNFWHFEDSPVHFLSTDRAPQPQKQRPSFGAPTSHITRKSTGCRARLCFHLWIHALLNCYTSQLLDDGEC